LNRNDPFLFGARLRCEIKIATLTHFCHTIGTLIIHY
jgi:hypothetical protein